MPIRVYLPVPSLIEGQPMEVPAATAHKLRSVLRLSDGAVVSVFNGRDGEWRARLRLSGRRTMLLVPERRLRAQTSGPDLWILVSPVKKSAMDMIAEKATELGASVIHPVMCQNTRVARVNVDRLQATANDAAEQCERIDIPRVLAPESLQQVLDAWPAGRPLLFCDESGTAPAADSVLADQQKRPGVPTAEAASAWALLIGPEGGFTADERNRLYRTPFVTPIDLGPRVLRVETAVLAAMALWQARLGDWGQARQRVEAVLPEKT